MLHDNHQQSLAVSLEARDGAGDLASQAALMARLEGEGLLDRAVAGLPGAAVLQARLAAGEALLRPEIAALLLWLTDAIEASDLPGDPAFGPTLLAYFPRQLREGFARFAERHQLRKELIATAIVNTVANRLGPAALARLAAEADPVRVARACWLASAVFELEAACDAIDTAPAPADTRLDALLAVRRLHEAAARDLLASPELDQPLAAGIAALRPGIAALARAAAEQAAPGQAAAQLREAGLDQALAALIAALPVLAAALAIVRLAGSAGVPPADAAAAWHRAGQALGLDGLRRAAAGLPVQGAFGGPAKAALLADLNAAQLRLAKLVLGGTDPATIAGSAPVIQLVRDVGAAPDLAGLSVAARALAALGA